MEADTKLIYEKYDVRLLEVTTRHGEIKYCVLNNGPTRFFDDFEDALEEYNYRWLQIEYDE